MRLNASTLARAPSGPLSRPLSRSLPRASLLAVLLCACSLSAFADETPTLDIVWPPEGATVQLGSDAEAAVGVVVRSNFVLRAAGQ